MRIGDPKNHAVDFLESEITSYVSRRNKLAADRDLQQKEIEKLDEILKGLQDSIRVINEASNNDR